MSPAAPLLEIENLVVEIQSMPALRGFCLHVDKGAMVGLVDMQGDATQGRHRLDLDDQVFDLE